MHDDDLPLGRNSAVPDRYDPQVLRGIPRERARGPLGIASPPPFDGEDVWNAYEVSWLSERGQPRAALAVLRFPCQSPRIVESKSLKLYLASLHQERGGATVIARFGFNELWSFVAGWAILLDYLILIALTAFSTTDYAAVFCEPFDSGTPEFLLGASVVIGVAIANVRGRTGGVPTGAELVTGVAVDSPVVTVGTLSGGSVCADDGAEHHEDEPDDGREPQATASRRCRLRLVLDVVSGGGGHGGRR